MKNFRNPIFQGKPVKTGGNVFVKTNNNVLNSTVINTTVEEENPLTFIQRKEVRVSIFKKLDLSSK
jgi:hypothetical protein